MMSCYKMVISSYPDEVSELLWPLKMWQQLGSRRQPTHIQTVRLDQDLELKWNQTWVRIIAVYSFHSYDHNLKIVSYSTANDSMNFYEIWYYRVIALILSRVGILKDPSLLESVDIPARDNIHQYWCNNPFIILCFLNVKVQFWTSEWQILVLAVQQQQKQHRAMVTWEGIE